MQHVPALAQSIFKPFNQRVGQRSRLSCFTEVVFKSSGKAHKARPDGLLELHTGLNKASYDIKKWPVNYDVAVQTNVMIKIVLLIPIMIRKYSFCAP
jgi:hypothetical protein